MISANETYRSTGGDSQSRFEYVEVLLPLPLAAKFTYRLPPHLVGKPAQGSRVIVPFGRKKFYTAIVVGFANLPPQGIDVKEVVVLLDTSPVVRHPQLQLWNWVADYYLAALGDVYKAAVPAGLKIESETHVEINPDFEFADGPAMQLSERDAAILQLIAHEGSLTPAAIESRLKAKGIASAINALIERGVLIVAEKLNERYRPKKVQMVKAAFTPDETDEAFRKVSGARKQEALLLAYIDLSGMMRGKPAEVSRDDLLARAGVLPAILSAVIKKGVLEAYAKEVNRFAFTGEPTGNLPRLTDAQQEALDAIHKTWHSHDVTLLHGVTSSGKTEIYIHLINFVLQRGDQALMLVPEIALTTQLTRRLQKVFGSRVVIYHSKFSDSERVDIWRRLLTSTDPLVVIGARSAVFLPFAHLGLVIVDEEHESSYKQYDPAPRYNGRDVAVVLAKMHGAKTLLGSATPSIESYYKAKNDKFGLVKLSARFGNATLPQIRVIDMNLARQAKAVKGAFAAETIGLAREALDKGSQIILFQNRRGYAPLARCRQCAWVPRCANCDVALTYHNSTRQLQCHYCGAVYTLPKVCPQCHEPAIEIIGYGTERIEEEVVANFPGYNMLRMDLDTTRSKESYGAIIDDFSAGKARILVGTQMVTKGLDFGGVSLVAVLNADAVINYPDFRASERAFNMLEQVAGRAGRREGADGTVAIQTYNPAQKVLGFVRRHDYEAFYESEIADRKSFLYPPFSRIVNIYLRHKNADTLKRLAVAYATRLRALLGSRVYGPEEPSVGRIQNLYIRKIMLKIETTASMRKVKDLLRQTHIDLIDQPDMKQILIHFDVDPC